MEIGVYGLGRFGYFWAQLLSGHFSVRAYSRNPERPLPPGVKRVSLEELWQAEVVFLCTAISSLEDVLRESAPLVRPGTLVADTCSVKVHPARVMEEILPAGTKLLATHPMFGPDSARDGLQDLPLMLHPLRDSQEESAYWKEVFASWGLRVLEMTPEEHDHAAAYTQGVTHFMGRVLGRMGLEAHPLGTRGYQSLLEIVQQTCNDPYQLFLDMQKYNPYTPEMRENLRRALDGLLGALSQSAPEEDRPQSS